jgi:hypothetical protein
MVSPLTQAASDWQSRIEEPHMTLSPIAREYPVLLDTHASRSLYRFRFF